MVNLSGSIKVVCDKLLLNNTAMTNKDRRDFLRKAIIAAGGAVLLPSTLGQAMAKRASNTRSSYEPGYLQLHANGQLKARGDVLWEMMRSCNICPRECNVNRIRGRKGTCNANSDLEVSSMHPHFGEERELVGNRGSGTIFFTNCALLCVFCLNYDISQRGRGQTQSITGLANFMLSAQRMGCHNVNLVTPSHYVPHILLALDRAAARGLRIPVVYNSSGWEKVNILQLLDGVVDVYLPDFKFADSVVANRLMPGASSYPEVTQKALIEMNRQVGLARPDESGLINRGLMIRHLVMPNNAARSDQIMQWIAANLPRNTYVNIMSQYTPVFRASEFPEINRRITRQEYNNVVTAARRAGLTNLRLQG